MKSLDQANLDEKSKKLQLQAAKDIIDTDVFIQKAISDHLAGDEDLDEEDSI